MKGSDRIRGLAQAGSGVIVASALGMGIMASAAGASPRLGLEPGGASTEEQDATDELGLVSQVLPADLMSDAATQARKIEIAREKRARVRAHRSSGQMFTPTRNYKYSAVFGQAGGWSSGHHTGLDFAAPDGTPVMSALAGEVVKSGYDGAYGNRIIVRHAQGIKTMYAHLSSTAVEVGDEVLRGERIGAVGTTGNSSGPHLHFEVIKKGTQRDPQAYL
jgi:murein DD-endopeptidase MepM/ murein hydrolase activator NlpD